MVGIYLSTAFCIEVIQASYDIESHKTYNREINGLLLAMKVTQCDRRALITAYTEATIEIKGKVINEIPCYKW